MFGVVPVRDIKPSVLRPSAVRDSSCAGDDYVFPSESGTKRNRHLSPRTAQRIMERAVRIAGITKRATPHSLRHSFATNSFATHSFEDGHDICRIQQLLGHLRLETTTIYVKVARPADEAAMPSPLDKLYHAPPRVAATKARRKTVGQLRIHFLPQPSDVANCRCAKVTLALAGGVFHAENDLVQFRYDARTD